MEDTRRDEDIARLIQQGDSTPFGILVDRYEEKLRRYARKFLADTEDVTDLIQDVFVKAYTNIQSFDASRRFSPWIYRIAHNEIVNRIRGRVSTEYLPLDLDVVFPHLAADEQADTDAYMREMRDILDTNLGEVSPKYRETLILYFYEELSYKEIAEVLKIPIATVGVRIGRGKALLKKRLAEKHTTLL